MLLFAPAAARGQQSFSDFLKRLAAAGQKNQTLEARFTQRKQMTLFNTAVVTKGVVTFRKPQQLRWETFPPDQSLLIIDGQRAELRLPGVQPRVMDLSAGGALAALVHQMLFWLGAQKLIDFQKEYQGKLSQKKGWTTIHLIPRYSPLKQRISFLKLTLDPRLLLRRIQVQQRDGDQTIIEFFAIKQNGKLLPLDLPSGPVQK